MVAESFKSSAKQIENDFPGIMQPVTLSVLSFMAFDENLQTSIYDFQTRK